MTKFDEKRAEQRYPRTWMPAEACTEFGLGASRMIRPVNWFTRWMSAMRRRLMARHPSPHG